MGYGDDNLFDLYWMAQLVEKQEQKLARNRITVMVTAIG